MQPRPELLKIGDFARLAGTNLRTLRYYEELGLIAPTMRSQGGFRYYRPNDLQRVRLIHDLQALGLPLEKIRDLVRMRDENEPRDQFLERVRRALEEQDALLHAKLAELEEQRRKVAQALHKLGECKHCQHVPEPGNNYCDPCSTTGEKLPEHLGAHYT